jgi:predicted acyltransferase
VVRMAACFQFQVEQSVPTLGGAIMRYAIALAAAVLIGFGVKLFFFPAPAEADASGVKSSSMNVLQMHHKGLPVQKMSDMTFVFSDD